ncbi:MAG TPA: hypothetical protein VGC62_19045 [Pseudomonas sp.]|uniref:hypothetical protein n=1 Tax=Pseudomonas sp. TaxID=306 RepID=UPI002ED925C9
MSCLICAGVAQTIDESDQWEERDCPNCGRYRMDANLVLTLMEQGQIFDVEKMRLWLKHQRRTVNIPHIVAHEALLAL